MKLFSKVLLSLALAVSWLPAQDRVIVRALGGQTALGTTCSLLGCSVIRGLDDPAGQLFLVGTSAGTSLTSFLAVLLGQPGILDAEPDLPVHLNGYQVPDSLYDTGTQQYYGATVRSGYVNQPAAQIIRLADAQSSGLAGADTIAIIDTGVDPSHPVLAPVLLTGYDYTRNRSGGSEAGDVTQSTAAVVDGVQPAFVNSSTAAVVDQTTASTLNTSSYAAFGHGTMVAGVAHLVAPRASILPLKAFGPNGSGYRSDILRAVYGAVRSGARVINMSFSMRQSSVELQKAVQYATSSGSVCVAAAGNDGQSVTVYPEGFPGVIGVASTNNQDARSAFSNYGSGVWVAAPGEGVVTTYPYGTYAAAWGTSFSTPLVSGAVSLVLDAHPSFTPSDAAGAIGQAAPAPSGLGHGRLDIVQAIH